MLSATDGNVIKTPYLAAKWFAKTALNLQHQTLGEYTEETSLNPIILIDDSLRVFADDMIEDLLQTVLSIHTAQYLVAVSYETEINGVKVVDILRKFATQTSMTGTAIRTTNGAFGLLDIDDGYDGLPLFGLEGGHAFGSNDDARRQERENHEAFLRQAAVNREHREQDRHSAEIDKGLYQINRDDDRDAKADFYNSRNDDRAQAREQFDKDKFKYQQGRDAREDGRTGLKSSYDNSNSIHTITDASNLTVGKIIDVKLVSNGVTVTVPVRAVLSPKYITPEDFIEISGNDAADMTSTGRWRLWRSGAIGFNDYMFCTDLVQQYKRRLMADKTGTLMSANVKKMKVLANAIASGEAAPNAVSTGVIITKRTATALENKMGGNLSNPNIRKAYFDGNNTCLLIVVDTTRENFVLYQKGIADHRTYTFNTISKNRAKGNAVDIKSVLEAYKLGNGATL